VLSAPRVRYDVTRRRSGEPSEEPLGEQPDGLPDVGRILKRLRQERGLSLHQVAARSGLSASFLSAVERGQSDIALQRLARLARIFNHDVGSLLGYYARRAEPQFVRAGDRFKVDRGKGVQYEVIRLPGLDFELIHATFSPRSRFRDELTHEGVDIGFCASGELVLVYNKREYTLGAGECAVWSGAYPHTLRNDADEPALFVSVVTETVF
jgi:transcriptional regulator with XRE-family HTH domain